MRRCCSGGAGGAVMRERWESAGRTRCRDGRGFLASMPSRPSKCTVPEDMVLFSRLFIMCDR